MNIDPQISNIERDAKAAKMPMAPVLREAGVTASTWWRWRHAGIEPRLSTLRRVREALDRSIGARG